MIGHHQHCSVVEHLRRQRLPEEGRRVGVGRGQHLAGALVPLVERVDEHPGCDVGVGRHELTVVVEVVLVHMLPVQAAPAGKETTGGGRGGARARGLKGSGSGAHGRQALRGRCVHANVSAKLLCVCNGSAHLRIENAPLNICRHGNTCSSGAAGAQRISVAVSLAASWPKAHSYCGKMSALR